MTFLVPIYAGAKPYNLRRRSGEGKLKLSERKFETNSEEFVIEPDGFSREDMARWRKSITSYPNIVGEGRVAESASHFVEEVLVKHRQRMQVVWQRWAALQKILRVNSVSRMFPDSDVHVPELYKALETLVPRIIEPILENDPWFVVTGRDADDRRRAKVLEEWLRHQLALNKFDTVVEDLARVMIAYGFVAVKTWWECDYKKRIHRDIEEVGKTKEGFPRIRVTETEVEEPVYEGCKMQFVDPYDFVFDPERTRVEDMRYVGDICEMGEDELRAYAEDGIFDPVKVQEALDVEHEARQSRMQEEYWKDIRTLQSGRDVNRTEAEGGPRTFKVVELWATWSPGPGEEFDEYVITKVGDVVVRVQKNPHYDRHRPYAVGRSAKDPNEFINVGPLDHALRVQQELDDNENLMLQGHHLRQCPVIFAGHDFDGPPSIFEVEPGTVFRTSEPVTPIQVPDAVMPSLAIKEDGRREIEEVTGAIKLFGGSEASGGDTATESERKVKEGNRRLRRMIYCFADMLTQMLGHFLELSRQNVTFKQSFRVLGRSAAEIGDVAEVTIEDLEVPHDVQIRGLRGLQQHGLRGTQMATFMSTFYPLMGQLVQEGRINVGEFLEEAAESMLGDRLGKRVIKPEQPLSQLIDAEDENVLLGAGMKINIHEADNHEEHSRKHAPVLEWARKNGRDEVVRNVVEHIGQHDQEIRAESARMRRQMDQSEMTQAAMPELHHTQEGRYDQGRADLQGELPQSTPPGETPGPGMAHQQSAPDRTNGIPQTENRTS